MNCICNRYRPVRSTGFSKVGVLSQTVCRSCGRFPPTGYGMELWDAARWSRVVLVDGRKYERSDGERYFPAMYHTMDGKYMRMMEGTECAKPIYRYVG